ncbi:PREDICTED: protein SIEVE ELEMENT OCCLUSION B-like isoform X2 [Ipomoea nil]|uniref:protein SIEVE ELEMENT OCCLUSION B-like isoform X2 n=1 Tax=Ipomoea nil TaxID=35883 RepID=UPI0009013261|nr:PREDICTED: protein SIEVE ELEMENT OCCLUSION B-like isoform X2 [Ipomoea nil]
MAVSHINESVIMEEVMSTHNPDGKENFKINVIFDLVKSILYPTTIGDSIDEDEDSDKEDSNGNKSDEEDSNGDTSDDEEDSNGDKSDEEDSNGDKSDEEDSNGDRSDEKDSNGQKSDEEDSNDDKSDEEDTNGDKSDEENFNGEKSDEEDSNGDDEVEYAENMELLYQLKRFSFEISLGMMCPNNVNLHSMVIYFLRMLSTFSWESKLLIMLAAFSLNFGEFSLVHSHKGLSGKLAILKGHESQVLPMVTHFMKSILHLTEHIIELAQSSSHNSSPIILIGCYWIVTSILTYASYFTSGLGSMHSGYFIGGETQLSSLTIKIIEIISDCRPILEEKREVDSYNALCHAFFDKNPIIPSISSNLDILKLVFNVKKGGKQKFIYDGVRRKMVDLHVLKNKSLLLLMSSSLDIDMMYLILILNDIQEDTQLHVLWIPILDSSILWDIKHMEEQYKILVNESKIFSVRNVQKSVAPRFVRFVKEKFFPEFQIGGEPIIVSLDHNGRMVHRNAMHMVLMRGFDICRRMSGGIKSGDSIIPLLQKILTERVSTVRDLVPGIDRKISEVTNKVDGIINDWFRDIEQQIQNPVDSNIFTSKKEKDLWKIETWCTQLVAACFDDYITSKWIEEDMCIFLIGGHDIQWVKTFESKVMLEIQFNPQSNTEMVYVGSNMEVASMIFVDENCRVQAAPIFSWLFWARIQSIFMTGVKFIEETHGDEECDEILQGVKKLLAYEANDLVVNEWAMLCKGNKIVVCDVGDKMLKVMNEYDKWKENAIAKGFDQAFKDYHDEMFDSASTSQHHHHRCALKYPCNFDSVPQNVKCLECCHGMQKFATFKCCHDNVVVDDDDDSD